MNITKEAKKQKALRRLHVLADKFDLGPKLENHLVRIDSIIRTDIPWIL